eukprot:5815833-Alexandrium_andersonii.AAC.1
MSASLVGSEMCIRDRQKPTLNLCKIHEAPLPQEAIDLPPWRKLVHMPVSYTHLTLPTICSV